MENPKSNTRRNIDNLEKSSSNKKILDDQHDIEADEVSSIAKIGI